MKAQPSSVKIADLNGDSLPDLAVADLGPGSDGTGASGATVLMQDATRPGVFLTAQSFAGFGQPLAVAVADLNGDGIADIAVADGDTATVMYQGTTPGTFTTIGQIN